MKFGDDTFGPMSLSYRNISVELFCKSDDWFLCDCKTDLIKSILGPNHGFLSVINILYVGNKSDLKKKHMGGVISAADPKVILSLKK